jgi:hypothetical protein
MSNTTVITPDTTPIPVGATPNVLTEIKSLCGILSLSNELDVMFDKGFSDTDVLKFVKIHVLS